MSVERQNNQLELAFRSAGAGETQASGAGGTEALITKGSNESPAGTEQLMEEALERENLIKALRRVKSNGGCAGVDGMTVESLVRHLGRHWTEIRQQLLAGKYSPQAIKRVTIPKRGRGERELGIPTVLDRLIQQAILQVLQRRWDKTFSDQSYGFRPGRSTHQAVLKAQEHIAQGYGWVVDIDLERFFDRVNHDLLMGRVAKRVSDKRLLKLIRGFLKAGILDSGLTRPREEGTPQGGPLSPLLSNLLLDGLDRELERRGHRFVRYADDCNIYVRSERAGKRVMESITRFIDKKLKLRINSRKSAVSRPAKRRFLGFSFTPGRSPRRRIDRQALEAFKGRVRQLTRRNRGISLEQRVGELARYLRGWGNYFGICQTPYVLTTLDRWVRRRLRSAIWHQWHNGSTRRNELRRRGVGRYLAATTASSGKGPWRISLTLALNIALPSSFFSALGLPSLAALHSA
jgi:RNA-directed DNA polymerase